MTYNLSNFTSANNVLDLTLAADQLTNGVMFTYVLIAIFLISFTATKAYETKYSFMTASFITFILAGILWGSGLIGERSLVVTFVLLLFSFVFNLLSD